jgi:hypothetical protein
VFLKHFSLEEPLPQKTGEKRREGRGETKKYKKKRL